MAGVWGDAQNIRRRLAQLERQRLAGQAANQVDGLRDINREISVMRDLLAEIDPVSDEMMSPPAQPDFEVSPFSVPGDLYREGAVDDPFIDTYAPEAPITQVPVSSMMDSVPLTLPEETMVEYAPAAGSSGRLDSRSNPMTLGPMFTTPWYLEGAPGRNAGMQIIPGEEMLPPGSVKVDGPDEVDKSGSDTGLDAFGVPIGAKPAELGFGLDGVGGTNPIDDPNAGGFLDQLVRDIQVNDTTKGGAALPNSVSSEGSPSSEERTGGLSGDGPFPNARLKVLDWLGVEDGDHSERVGQSLMMLGAGLAGGDNWGEGFSRGISDAVTQYNQRERQQSDRDLDDLRIEAAEQRIQQQAWDFEQRKRDAALARVGGKTPADRARAVKENIALGLPPGAGGIDLTGIDVDYLRKQVSDANLPDEAKLQRAADYIYTSRLGTPYQVTPKQAMIEARENEMNKFMPAGDLSALLQKNSS